MSKRCSGWRVNKCVHLNKHPIAGTKPKLSWQRLRHTIHNGGAQAPGGRGKYMNIRLLFLWSLLFACLQGNAQLTAQFSADQLSGCAPIRVIFTDQSTGTPDRWRWDLGNGVISTAQNPSTTYFTPGVYTVSLTVYRGTTDSATITKTSFINVYANPTVNFGAVPRFGCLPLSVQFTDSSIAGSGTLQSWTWDFGDGTLSNQRNPLHSYTTPGSFTITLTVQNSEGCSRTLSLDNYVRVGDSLLAQFTKTVARNCVVPVNVAFTSTSIGTNITSWQWNFGDGNSSAATNPIHTYNAAGEYDVELIVTNAGGCSDTIIQRAAVTVGSPTAAFNIGAGPFCIGRPVAIQNTSTPFATFDSTIWRFSDGVVVRQRDVSRIFNTPGVYTFSMAVWKGGCVDSTQGSFTVLDKPAPTFSYSPAIGCRVPHVVNFQNTTPNSTVIGWTFGNGQTSTQQSATATYNSLGTFSVRMIVRHDNGCIDTLNVPAAVRVEAPRITSISGLPFDGCVPYVQTFVPVIVTNDSIVSYAWDFGDGTTAAVRNPTKTFGVAGSFTVRLTITTLGGCTATLTGNVLVSEKPVAAFTATPRDVCPSTDVSFTDQSTGAITRWQWFFGDGGSSGTQNPTYQYNDTGWMNVRLIVSNNQCHDTLTVNRYIYVRPPIARFTDSFSCTNQFQRFFTNASIGGTQWKWYFGNGDSSSTYSPNYTYTNTGAYTVRLVASDSLCEHEASIGINIYDEEANIEMEKMGTCRSNELRFYARGPKLNPANIANYEWTINAESPINTGVNFLDRVLTDTATLVVRLVITDRNGCSDTTLQTFTIADIGTRINFGPIRQDVCVGSLVNFTDSTRFTSTNPVRSWEWNFGFGNDSVFTSAPFGVVYNAAGVYNVRLTVVDSLGCRYTLTRPAAVEVHESTARFIASDTLVCLNTPIRFTNQSIGSNGSVLTYNWDFGNGQQSTILNPSVTYAAEGVYTVSLAIADSYGCVDTLTRPQYITVANARASFSMSDSFSTCPPLLVIFSNTSINNRQNFWDFGNGNNSIVVSPAHTFTSPGIFNVKLRVVGNGGCVDSVTRQVEIRGPQGTFTYGPLIGCPPLGVSFSATTINTRYYTWDYSDGTSDLTGNNTANHNYLTPGSYVPRLILEDGLGCKVPVQGTDTIHVLGARALIQSVMQNAFCDSATVSFTDSSITNDIVVRYRWRFGDGIESSLRNPTHTYRTPGVYQVTFEVWTANNCYASDTLDVPVIISPSPQLAYNAPPAVCVPAQVQFTGVWLNADTTQMSYQWSFGNGQVSNQLIPSLVSYTLPGTYNVQLIGVNRFGCTDTVLQPLIVNDTPRVVAGPGLYICRGTPQALLATGAATYVWDADPTLSCTSCASPLANPPSNRIYRVTGTDVNGCTSSDTALVRVKAPGILSIGLGDTICVGESVQLRSQGYDILSWSPSAGLSNPNVANPVARPVSTTRYRVTGSDSLGCFTDSAFVSVVVYPIPQFNIVETSIRTAGGVVVPLRTQSSPDIIRWSWSPAQGLSCIVCPEPNATVNRRITYTATATNAGGCVAKDTIFVEPYCTGDNVFLPNTFSPNGDGQNDVFYPRGEGVIGIKSMIIFNRWGEVMYERKNFALNDPTTGWNGTYKGVALTPDVYVYLVEVQCGNNEIFGLKGNVTLLK